jgi:hypothetical protein
MLHHLDFAHSSLNPALIGGSWPDSKIDAWGTLFSVEAMLLRDLRPCMSQERRTLDNHQ